MDKGSRKCKCKIFRAVCSDCHFIHEEALQRCPEANARGKMCADCPIMEMPSQQCTGCKERGNTHRMEPLLRFGHGARRSVSSFKDLVPMPGRQRSSVRGQKAKEHLIGIRYEQTRPADSFYKYRPAAERLSTDDTESAYARRLTRWPSVLDTTSASTSEPHSPQIPISTSIGTLRPPDGDTGSAGGFSLLPVPDFDIPPRPTSMASLLSEASDSPSEYSQVSLPRAPQTRLD
ncbi:hypothetical protein HIM_08064 [Hirsutella minnesotensis 3608]|uniref:Uncharacterized protein n=1 Tax=Hirsutella minnesotensis 3608 TaxID=1043627 RepID=A0A0F7ZMT1_9HYPO|nr:hypothetical protein HIM_08064 [Hirsutella minnesotensis 3608]